MAEPTVPSPGIEGGPGREATREPTRSDEMYVSPAADIYEDDQGLVVIADVPGVEPAALDVGVERGILTIRGRASHLVTTNPVHREYELTGFFRQFQLPDEVDAARIEAELKNGVLFLRLPRIPRAQPHRIQVRSD